jgi:hypothetical protein
MPQTVVAALRDANCRTITGPWRRDRPVVGPLTTVETPETAPKNGPSLRPAERAAAIVALLIVFALLIAGFARLARFAGLERPVGETVSSLPGAPPTGASPAPTVVPPPSSVPPPSVPSNGTPSSPVGTTDPSSPTTLPGESALPPRWPVSLPDPGEHVLLGAEGDGEDRWLLAVPGNATLSGGRFIGGLEDLDWDVTAVSTGRTATAVGKRGQERVAVSIRPGGELAPDGWVLLEVVYQPVMPDFEVPPTSTLPPEKEAARRS